MLLLTGSYTEALSPAIDARGKGMSLFDFSEESGQLTLLDQVALRNPSYPIWDKPRQTVWVAEEIMASDNPCLAGYVKQAAFSLTRQKSIPVPVSFACHIAVVGEALVLANYLSSDIGIISGIATGKERIHLIRHSGSGKDPERQEAPHPHMILPLSEQSFYVVDLGLDALCFYQQNSSGNWELLDSMGVNLMPGSGARHMISIRAHSYLVVLAELNGVVFLLKGSGAGYVVIDRIRLHSGNKASAAAIVVDAFDKFIYVSERSTNTIYCLEIINDRICQVGAVDCQGQTPRAISIAPVGNWLLSANQDSNSITVFKRNPLSGQLQFSHSSDVDTPNSFCWLD